MDYLDGRMLVAMPSMPDEQFARTVTYMCAHSAEGAMGIVMNQKAAKVTFPDLLVQLDVIPADEAIQLQPEVGGVQILKGGPMETERSFVLHSSIHRRRPDGGDRRGVSLTATLDILRAIAHGAGPRKAALRRWAMRVGDPASSRARSPTTAG